MLIDADAIKVLAHMCVASLLDLHIIDILYGG